MATRDQRLARNQRMSRDANERLQDVAGRMVADGKIVPFLCECADGACMGRIEVTLDDYFLAHLGPDRYLLLSGHLRTEGEKLVADHGHYEILTKAAA
jgi:hypothetical protein